MLTVLFWRIFFPLIKGEFKGPMYHFHLNHVMSLLLQILEMKSLFLDFGICILENVIIRISLQWKENPQSALCSMCSMVDYNWWLLGELWELAIGLVFCTDVEMLGHLSAKSWYWSLSERTLEESRWRLLYLDPYHPCTRPGLSLHLQASNSLVWPSPCCGRHLRCEPVTRISQSLFPPFR